LLKKANICTIHSFCLEIIKNNFFEIDLTSNFKIASEEENELLKQEVLENIFDRYYENDDEQFNKLLEMYTDYKDDIKFRDVHLGYIIGCILMIVVMFFIISIYGSEFSSMVRFPEFLILKKIDIMGYLSNIENVLVTEWMFNVLISSWVCVKVLRDNMNKRLFLIVILVLVFGSEILLNRNYVNVLYVKQYFYYIAFGLVLLSLVIKKRKS
jgi:hypothetical protein